MLINDKKTYGPAEVEKKTGIPTTRIHFYVKEGLISIGDPGRGKMRRFNRKNIFQLLCIDAFRSNGLELSMIKRIFEYETFKYAFEFSTYEVENPTGVFFVAWDIGRNDDDQQQRIIGVKLIRDPKTKKRSDKVEIDMSNYSGAVVINLRLLFDRLQLM